MDRVRSDLTRPFQIAGHILHTTGSVGFSYADVDADTSPEQLLADADAAMYLAKAEGR